MYDSTAIRIVYVYNNIYILPFSFKFPTKINLTFFASLLSIGFSFFLFLDEPAITICSSDEPAITICSSDRPAITIYSFDRPAITIYSSDRLAIAIYSSFSKDGEFSNGIIYGKY